VEELEPSDYHFRSMPVKFDAKRLRLFSITVACGGLLTMAQWSPGTVPMPPARLADMCNVDRAGNVVPSQTVIGRLSEARGSYFVLDDSGHTVLVSRCIKGGCAPFDRKLVRGHDGEPVQAEFCSNHPARLLISGVEVYRLTQQVIDENIAGIHHMQSMMRSIGAAWCGAWLLFQVSMEWFGRRRRSS
jgi:hypothetical protein